MDGGGIVGAVFERLELEWEIGKEVDGLSSGFAIGLGAFDFSLYF